MRLLERITISFLLFCVSAQAGGAIFFGQNVAHPLLTDLFCGDGCACTSSNTCTQEATTQNGISGFTVGQRVDLPAHTGGYTVKAGAQYMTALDGTAPQIMFAVYDDSPTPIKVCQVTVESTPTAGAGWKENTNWSSCVLAAGTYGLAVQNKGDGNTVVHGAGLANVYGFFISTYGTFPSPTNFGVTASYSMYLRVTPN